MYVPNNPLLSLAGVNGQNSKLVCQGGKPGPGKLYTHVYLCGSTHTIVCVFYGLRAMVAH